MSRRCATTMLLCLVVVLGRTAYGQGLQATQEPALPNATESIEACLTVQEWLQTFDLPAPDDAAAQVPLTDASGVCTIVRLRGRVLASGTAALHPGLERSQMVRRSAGRAFAQSLGDSRLALLRENNRESDNLLGSRLTLEFEVAGPLLPIAGGTWSQVGRHLVPGRDGIVMRYGETRAVRFPSQMLATGTADRIGHLLPTLARELGLPPQEFSELRRSHGISVYRFRTIHLAQRAPGRFPQVLDRGQLIVPLSDITPERLRRQSAVLVDHLLGHLFAHNDVEPYLMGDYHPIAGKYDPQRAAPRDVAFVALALARASREPNLAAAEAERRRAGHATLLGLIAEAEFDDTVTAAAVVLACHGHPEVPIAQLPAPVQELEQRARGLVLHGSVDAPHAAALHAAAIARLAAVRAEGATTEMARAAVERAWSAVAPERAVALLPWIGEAELDLAAGGPIHHPERLIELRSVLERTRVRGTANPDENGGFALSGGRGLRGHAAAQTLRPAVFLARMLRQPDLTPPAALRLEAERNRQTMRFVCQLAVGDDLLWSFTLPNRVIGGIRQATWSPEMPLAAQAMGLLALSETLAGEN